MCECHWHGASLFAAAGEGSALNFRSAFNSIKPNPKAIVILRDDKKQGVRSADPTYAGPTPAPHCSAKARPGPSFHAL
jgi:hypothetical protein